jgi:hypothetical protein
MTPAMKVLSYLVPFALAILLTFVLLIAVFTGSLVYALLFVAVLGAALWVKQWRRKRAG